MIDPRNVTNYERSATELEEFALFSVAVAGHNAANTAAALDRLLAEQQQRHGKRSPFDLIRLAVDRDGLAALQASLRRAGMGCWRKNARAFYDLARAPLDLADCDVGALEGVYGIGPKTARFFLLHSRRGFRGAVLDRHVLRWLDRQGVPNVPASTPTGSAYRRLESELLCRVPPGQTPAQFDLQLWNEATSGYVSSNG